MRVLLSGTSGLIGTALKSALSARGDECISLVRPSSSPTQDRSLPWDPSIRWIDTDALADLGPVDAVVNLAGAGIADKRWSAPRKDEILSSRLRSTSTLVDALSAMASPPAVLVSASAIGFYGDHGDTAIDESTARGEGFLAEVCDRWEEAARPVTAHGIRLVVARTGIVLSPLGGALAKQLPLFKAGVGGRLSSGKQWMSWISLDDEIAALLWTLDHDTLSGPVNLVAPHPVTNRDFTQALADVLHRPAVMAVPAPALKLALGADLVEEALLSSARVMPRALLASGFAFTTAELDVALRSLLA